VEITTEVPTAITGSSIAETNPSSNVSRNEFEQQFFIAVGMLAKA
jgi:hypothetical protein